MVLGYTKNCCTEFPKVVVQLNKIPKLTQGNATTIFFLTHIYLYTSTQGCSQATTGEWEGLGYEAEAGLRPPTVRWCCTPSSPFTLPVSWSSSNTVTTSFIVGRCLGSVARHLTARVAALTAAFGEYCPCIRPSMIRSTLLLLARNGLAHMIRFCSPWGRFLSRTRRPVNISRRTTPKLYTSLLDVRWPSKDIQQQIRSTNTYRSSQSKIQDFWLNEWI